MDKIGLYIHWPYCARICPYCDFNIYKNRPDMQAELVDAMLADMEYWRVLSGPRKLVSIHFGGGTPSLLAAANIQKLIAGANNLWTPAENLEIGLEANPKDITQDALTGWRNAGIERLSIGVQSFDDHALRFLGRDHDGDTASRALAMAVKAMPRLSADLIYGWAGQTPDKFCADLQTVLASGVTHISAYQLTIEQKTAFGRAERRGDHKAVDVDESANIFEMTIQMLHGAGFEQYEVSNFAKCKPAKSRHNLLYWQGGDYAGIGPGAHGRLTTNATTDTTTGASRIATVAARKPKDYIDGVRQHEHAIAEQETLSAEAWAEEYVLMGMRIDEGISLRRYTQISGQALAPKKIAHYEKAGLLIRRNDRLAATPKGRLVLDTLCRELLC